MKAVCTFTVEMMFEDHRDIASYDMREELEKIIQQRFSPDLINVNLDDEHTEGPDIEETDEEPSKSLMEFVGAAPDLQLERTAESSEWVIARRKDDEDKLEFYYLAIPDSLCSYPGFITTCQAAWTEDKNVACYFKVFKAALDIQKTLITKQSYPFVLSTNSGMFTRGIAVYLGNEKTATDY